MSALPQLWWSQKDCTDSVISLMLLVRAIGP